MSDEGIRTALADGVLRLEIDRRAKKNALTGPMYGALAEALQGADTDPAIRVVLIHGQSDLFTAGNDLGDFLARRNGSESPALAFLRRLAACRKPVIAAVGGDAVGIGTTLLLHCDLVYAGVSARFQLPFVNLGLCPEAASSLLLPRVAGYQRAAELLLFGEAFGPDQALAAGFVNAVLPDAELLPHAAERAVALAGKPASSVQVTKALLRKAAHESVATTMNEEFAQFSDLLAAPEARAIIAAFVNRRAPLQKGVAT